MSVRSGSASGMPAFSDVAYCGWSALRIEQGPLVLILVPEVGGRIMSVAWRGYGLSFVNPACQGRVLDLTSIADVHQAKRRFGFVLWGGDKTWLAPQDRWSDGDPFLDLDSGIYDLSVDRAAGIATMSSPVCRETGVRIERVVELGPPVGAWSVTSRLINASDRVVTWAPWDVDMMLRPATVFMPTSRTSVFPQGVRTFDNEGVSAAVRDDVVQFVDDVAVVSCRDAVKFKYGVDADVGRILAVLDTPEAGLVGYRKFVQTFHSEPYGHGCVLEIFNASAYPYIEMEVHGPVVSLQPGESFALRVDSALFDLDAVPSASASIREGLGVA
ncbi:MAG: hypothetical protein AAFX81_07610 [Pseudomonadota bacterium]